jgi:hypothetical protein
MIAARVGLGPRSVRRLLAKRKTMDGRLIPHEVRRNPLYDPHRDGMPELDTTATPVGVPLAAASFSRALPSCSPRATTKRPKRPSVNEG